VFVVPLDDAVDFLAVAQHDDHRRLGLHLLLIVEILGVGLLGGRGLLGRGGGTVSISISLATAVPVSAVGGGVVGALVMTAVRVVGARQGWANQFAVGKAFLIVGLTGGLFCWYGVERIFQIPPPARWAGRIYHKT
jgi:hypothetical protein